MNYTEQKLQQLTELNLNHAQAVKSLLKFYFHIRELWTKTAIDKLKQEYELDLRKKEHRLYFARYAAHQELEWKRQLKSKQTTPLPESPPTTESCPDRNDSDTGLEPSQEETPHDPNYKPSYDQLEWFACLCLLGRILPSGKPLNGSEESPAMRVLGSPKTLTELEVNYKQLIKHHHPDVSPFSREEAHARFTYLRKLYSLFRKNWETLKPTADISQEQLHARMNAKTPFKPDSFWYWDHES